MNYGEHDALRRVTRDLLLDLVHVGRLEGEQDLLDDKLTDEYVNGFMISLAGDDVADMLNEEFGRLSVDDRRSALCGWYIDERTLGMDTPAVTAQRLVSVVRWMRDGQYPLSMLPGESLALFGKRVCMAETLEKAANGDEESKKIVSDWNNYDCHAMDMWSKHVLREFLAKLSIGRRMSAGAFRRDLFDGAMDALIEKGDGYVADLKSALEGLDSDKAYLNAAAGLLEKVGADVFWKGDDAMTYEDGLVRVAVQLRWLDAIGSRFWFD